MEQAQTNAAQSVLEGKMSNREMNGVEAMVVGVGVGNINSSNTSIHLTIGGEPIAQPRHRLRRIVGSITRVAFYDPVYSSTLPIKIFKSSVQFYRVEIFNTFNRLLC